MLQKQLFKLKIGLSKKTEKKRIDFWNGDVKSSMDP